MQEERFFFWKKKINCAVVWRIWLHFFLFPVPEIFLRFKKEKFKRIYFERFIFHFPDSMDPISLYGNLTIIVNNKKIFSSTTPTNASILD